MKHQAKGSVVMSRLYYEAHALGLRTFGLPVLAVAVFVGVSWLAAYDVQATGGTATRAHADLALGLLFLLEFGLPPVAGIAAAYLVSGNPAIELHLALVRSYAATMFIRLGVLTLWATVVCAATSIAIRQAGYWLASQPSPLDQLIWLAPLLWFIAAGAMLSLLLRSRVAAGATLGMLWLGELFFRAQILQNVYLRNVYLFLTLETLPGGFAPDAAYWAQSRLTLLAMAAVFLLIFAALLRRNEALLGHEA
jgi:hypothetical protein